MHCENYSNLPIEPSTPPIYSVSWIYDNTRGSMKEYPFCTSNGGGNCTMNQYDVCFLPKLLHGSSTHRFNETNSLLIMQNGSLNYYQYSDILSNNCNIPILAYPNQQDIFYTSSPILNNPNYQRAYLAPYSILSTPLFQFRGMAPAGYINDGIKCDRIPGILHSYFTNENINLISTEISESDHIIYNPSDVTITASDLHFPSHYSFRTIRGVYPTPSEVAADNTLINGGPFNDPRQVPVTTDLRCEDLSFPHDETQFADAKYASLYRLVSGSKLTIKPCVSVFDAAFILNPGSVLLFSNTASIIGLHRVAIDRNGGRLIRQYNAPDLPNATLYLQDQTETAIAPNSYIVNAKIVAGENVDASQTAGPYIASTGTSLELIAKEYVKLEHGFKAEAGSAVKIFVDPSLVIPICPLSGSGGSGNRMVNNNAEQLIISATAHIKLMPSAFLESTGIYSEKEDDLIVGVDVYDITGKLIHRTSNILSNYFELSIPQVNEGIYFVKIKTQQNVKIIKVLKQ